MKATNLIFTFQSSELDYLTSCPSSKSQTANKKHALLSKLQDNFYEPY